MSIPIPAGMSRGRVSWRIGHDRAGSTLPGASGTVRFEPTAVAVAYSTATVLPEPVETPVIGGVMTPVDLQVNDPEIWNWKVQPRVGVTWEPFHVDVPGPVDLATAAVVPGVGPVRAVKGVKGDTPTWGDLPGKPTTFPPTAHQHTLADVDGLTTALAGKVDDDDSRLTDSRTPTAHKHAVADVDGLQTTLAALTYASGLRDISSLFPTRTEGRITVRRRGPVVAFTGDALRFSDSGTFTLAGALPPGFRPDSAFNGLAVQASGSDGYRIGFTTAGNFSIFSYSGGWVRFYFTFFTDNPIPTTLPGTPA